MIALDTNVLVRYLVRDDAEQADIAAGFLEKLSAERPGYVSAPVVTELEWLLRKGYRLEPTAIRTAITKLLEVPNLVFESEDAVRLAAGNRRGDFVDRLVHFLGEAAGCEKTVTFDRNFARLPGVELLKSES